MSDTAGMVIKNVVMDSRCLAGFVALILTLSLGAPAASAAPGPSLKQLRAKVKRLERDRDRWRLQARTASEQLASTRDALNGSARDQVIAITAQGSLEALRAAILEPIRSTWPCGASLFQGETFWSLDLDATTTRVDEAGNIVTKSCAP